VGNNQPIGFNNCPPEINQKKVSRWIVTVIEKHKRKSKRIIYNFVSREKMVEINRQYLNHDYETDIITFDYVEGDQISAEIYLCQDVIRKQTADFNVEYMQELHRVMIHGILHLLGLNDHTKPETEYMRKKENEYLVLLESDGYEI
jgi:probable rRNA maturation factor